MPVAVTCRVLGCSEQACYRWLHKPRSARETGETHLIGALHELHDEDPEDGYRVLGDNLHDLGYEISECRVWRLCWIAGLQSVITTRTRRYRKAGVPVGDDLVQRDFTADRLDERCLVDITEHCRGEGKLYLCAFKDVCPNRIVEDAIDRRMKASLAVLAPENALMRRGYPEGVIAHSDRGSQFRSRRFQKAF